MSTAPSKENTPRITMLCSDLSEAVLSDERVVPVHSVYDKDDNPTLNLHKATLVVVGPFTNSGSTEPQYINADLTGQMSLHSH